MGVCVCACACECVGVSQTGILCTSDEVLVVLHLLYLNRNTVETFANGWHVVFTDSGLKFTWLTPQSMRRSTSFTFWSLKESPTRVRSMCPRPRK